MRRAVVAVLLLFSRAVPSGAAAGKRSTLNKIPPATSANGTFQDTIRRLAERSHDEMGQVAATQSAMSPLHTCIAAGNGCQTDTKWQASGSASTIGNMARRALAWAREHTTKSGENGGAGIITMQGVDGKHGPIYREVTGYYIPTLLQYGEVDIALRYARYLVTDQDNETGLFFGMNSGVRSFDTAQILRGLVAILPYADNELKQQCLLSIRRAALGLLAAADSNGRLRDPHPGGRFEYPEGNCVYLAYCLPPILQAARVIPQPDGARVEAFAYKSAATYARMALKHLEFGKGVCRHTHFWAYAIEGLLDMGNKSVAQWAMKTIQPHVHNEQVDGDVQLLYVENPRSAGVQDGVCSPGLAQLGSIWLKLGQRDPAERALRWLARAQNCPTGGWFGSYARDGRPGKNSVRSYYPRNEVSWANKMVLDLVAQLRNYVFAHEVHGTAAEHHLTHHGSMRTHPYTRTLIQLTGSLADKDVLEVGAGAGVFCKALHDAFPTAHVVASDPSPEAVAKIPAVLHPTNADALGLWGLADASFDVVFAFGAVEHMIVHEKFYAAAMRVLRPGGVLVVVDKNRGVLTSAGRARLPPWEDWLLKEETKCQLAQAQFENISQGFVPAHGYAQYFAKAYAGDAKLDGQITLWFAAHKKPNTTQK